MIGDVRRFTFAERLSQTGGRSKPRLSEPELIELELVMLLRAELAGHEELSAVKYKEIAALLNGLASSETSNGLKSQRVIVVRVEGLGSVNGGGLGSPGLRVVFTPIPPGHPPDSLDDLPCDTLLISLQDLLTRCSDLAAQGVQGIDPDLLRRAAMPLVPKKPEKSDAASTAIAAAANSATASATTAANA